MNILIKTCMASSVIFAAACTSTGNTEKSAAIGAAGGAAAGAVIGNNVGDGDAKTGAIIGAVVGGAAGAYVGNQKDKLDEERMKNIRTGSRYYDEKQDRYYYSDPETGRTYWANGDRRS